FASSAERKGRTDYGISRADPLCQEDHQQRVGAAGTTYNVVGPSISTKLDFKLSDFRAIDELAMIEAPLDRSVDRIAQTRTLCRNINKRNSARMLVHLLPQEDDPQTGRR